MTQTASDSVKKFDDTVGIQFQLYNSLFLSLPFFEIEKTGTLLTLFSQACEKGYENGMSPADIVDEFFSASTPLTDERAKLDVLFRFVQYAERQVVLFDALEDAFFDYLHDMKGSGSVAYLKSKVQRHQKREQFAQRLEDFSVRLVLTAHPTQFYPGSVLGIINDLAAAIRENDAAEIKTLLQQLGRTPFFKKQKPTPFDEATSLIWYLENIFYHAIGEIVGEIRNDFPDQLPALKDLVKMGFWSGGDRDGNPFVRVDTTLAVANALRKGILRQYHADVVRIRRRLTFSGVETLLSDLEKLLYNAAFVEQNTTDIEIRSLLDALGRIRDSILQNHNGLFVELVDDLILKVEVFGLHFASLDIRQDSSIHADVYEDIARETDVLPDDFGILTEDRKVELILGFCEEIEPQSFEDELTRDTFAVVRAIRTIQETNGEQGSNRYIISNSQNALHVFEVFGLFLLSGWKPEDIAVDIVPLFETVEDLKNAADVMRKLYSNKIYREHLARRGDSQTIMLGFSDGTKDGGYLMANYGIYRAKDKLTEVSREFGVEVIFFDGRGGPPARGGGKTHKFYSSLGKNISDKSIEVTVQGQTVSSNFGTIDAARYNIEQLLSAGINNAIFAEKENTFEGEEEVLIGKLADFSFAAYSELKNDPVFIEYLENVSPLQYFAKANIGSRPSKRGGAASKLTLKSLRAIPFVGAWSQMKQNVPGFYGVGSAIEEIDRQGKLNDVTNLYENNPFFKALIDNSEMSMQKTFFPLTAHLRSDPVYGKFWHKIKDEFDRTSKYFAIITGRKSFMSDFPVARASVQMREKIVLPLTTIQQYALTKIREGNSELKEDYEKLVVRCSFGIINAGRNSA